MSVTIQRPVNDNRPGVSADFLRIPEVFCRVYSQELLDWASSLQEHGQFLDLALWNPPGATLISAGYQGKVRLRCDVAVNPTTKAVRLAISPDSDEDAARVARHCEELPAIMAAHRAHAEAARGKPRGAVTAVFNLPDYFVERYGFELREWGRNLKKIGLVKTIVLREGTVSDLSPDPEIGAVLLGVKLRAKIERVAGDELRLVISPASEMDERTVRKHVEKMTRLGVPAIASLVEPPRPGVPAFPNIIGAPAPPADGGV